MSLRVYDGAPQGWSRRYTGVRVFEDLKGKNGRGESWTGTSKHCYVELPLRRTRINIKTYEDNSRGATTPGRYVEHVCPWIGSAAQPVIKTKTSAAGTGR